MAKVVFKTTPLAAYEWAEVQGGDTMSGAERAALLDEFVTANGLVPVESDFSGEVQSPRYGRYKADGPPAAALAPTGLPGREADLQKANQDLDALKAENARLKDQLGKTRKTSSKSVVDGVAVDTIASSGGAQSTENALETLNTQEGVNITPGQEVRQDMSTADKSDDNPKVK